MMNLLSNREPLTGTDIHGRPYWSRVKQCILCALDPADLSAAVDEVFDDPTNYVLAISPALPVPDEHGIAFTQTLLYQEYLKPELEGMPENDD
jgi:hypothetical protein